MAKTMTRKKTDSEKLIQRLRATTGKKAQLINAMQDGIKGHFPEMLGMEFLHVSPERVTASLRVRPELCTLDGILHGGAIMAFADTLGAFGAVLHLPDGARTVTIESKTNFLGAAPRDALIFGSATPLHLGRTTSVWQTQIVGENGKAIALVTQTQLVLKG